MRPKPVAAGRLSQVGGNRDRAGDDVEEDVPLRSEQHQHDAAPAERHARSLSSAITTGKSIGAGNEATTCTTGCRTRDSRGERPIASPAGSAQSVPRTVAASTRPSVRRTELEAGRPRLDRHAAEADARGEPRQAEVRGATRQEAAWREASKARSGVDGPAMRRALVGLSRADERTRAQPAADGGNELRAPQPDRGTTRWSCLCAPPSFDAEFLRPDDHRAPEELVEHHDHRDHGDDRARPSRGTFPRATATLMYEPRPGRRKSLSPRTKASLIIRKNQPPGHAHHAVPDEADRREGQLDPAQAPPPAEAVEPWRPRACPAGTERSEW